MEKINMRELGAVILAAGASTRLGASKQLLVWRGKPLVRHTVDAALGAGFYADKTVVVVGANTEPVRAALSDSGVRIVENLSWGEGMGTSIRAGVEALHDVVSGVLISVCDQPFLSAEVVGRLLSAYKGGIVAARYGNHVGVPAIFGEAYFSDLLALGGAEGARKLLAKNAARVAAVDLPELAIDVDTPGDWERVQRQSI